MPPLPSDQRNSLEKAVIEARGIAEAAATAVLERLGAQAAESPRVLDQASRDLRTALRERAKALGGGMRMDGWPLLVEEIAYEQWHRMLFARFLAENGLLLHPSGASVSLDEVRELAADEGERDPWLLAARYAAAMLPGIFRADDPANRVVFAPEDRQRLEAVLESLPPELFTADDALGWVYQFWQAKKKDEVNKKGDKIGGADLPPVTQLFTEDYMVRFLLENSLGAWWAGRHPDSPLLKEWEYLRFRDDGTPAAGTFESWPTTAAEITVMDPCCGSGHFLVAAAGMLREMRIEEEGFSERQAAAAVIDDNIFGLELDARCLQLAAFNLALDAWKAGGYQQLPLPNLACSGIAIKGQKADWHRLAAGDDKMVAALDRLYDLFQDAPELGSLIDPRTAAGEGLWAVDPDELLDKLDEALQRETTTDPAAAVFGEAAKGTAQAARLLSGHYWLVATNPPYLTSRRMGRTVREFVAALLPRFQEEIATSMMGRWLGTSADHCAMVMPRSWLFQPAYRDTRHAVLDSAAVSLIAELGTGAFNSIGGEVVNVALCLVGDRQRASQGSVFVQAETAATTKTAGAISVALVCTPLAVVPQQQLLRSPGASISVVGAHAGSRLGDVARSHQGLFTGDNSRYMRTVWEVVPTGRWRLCQARPLSTGLATGRSFAVDWDVRRGVTQSPGARIQGKNAWGSRGIGVSVTGKPRVTVYHGDLFDGTMAVLTATSPVVGAMWTFATDDSFGELLSAVDPGLSTTESSYLKVPFDLEHWQKVAAEQYPNGLPEPQSDDPTQWLFEGDIATSESPLHVAVARLLGYRWPDQERDALDAHADPDGLVALPAVGGELPAAERLRSLLRDAYGDAWSNALLERLIAETGSKAKSLDDWLWSDFFKQHTKVFHNRPFIWHISDGRKDGFSVLAHYHRLDKQLLGRLTFSVLGDWIERQRTAGDETGAAARLSAAEKLEDELKLILEGEPPNDIYVRWKSIAEQPLGWDPDLDDGVRLNIRPFMTTNVLRAKPNIHWKKDRGKDPDGSERINDQHVTIAEKRTAREGN